MRLASRWQCPLWAGFFSKAIGTVTPAVICFNSSETGWQVQAAAWIIAETVQGQAISAACARHGRCASCRAGSAHNRETSIEGATLLLMPFLAGDVINAGLVAAIRAEFTQLRPCAVLARLGLQGLWTCAAPGDPGASCSANLPAQVQMRNDFRTERTIAAG